jgi:hypothetical protein
MTLFRWMGEVNLVQQALYDNGHEPMPAAAITEWDGFMQALREHRIPLAIHSNLGDDGPDGFPRLRRDRLDRENERSGRAAAGSDDTRQTGSSPATPDTLARAATVRGSTGPEGAET